MSVKDGDLAKQLEEEFFTPEFFQEAELVEKILKCSTLEGFRKIRDEAKPELMKRFFASAGFNDPEAKRFTEAELTKLFDSLPTLTSSEDEFV